MRKTINPARLAQGVVMLLAGLATLWLVLTRCYLYYVTPRTLPFLYFAAAMFLTLAVYNLMKLREAAHVLRYAHLLALALPLLLLGVSLQLQDLWQTPLFPGAEETGFNDPAALGETYTMQASGYEGRILHGYDEPNQTIAIPQEETYFWLIEIYTDPTPFLGYTIRTMGQVALNSAYLSADCFSPVRELMSCCVADVYSIGFPCQYAGIDTLTEGEWVTVTGTLTMVDLEEYQELRLLTDTVEVCAKPDEPYVYSY